MTYAIATIEKESKPVLVLRQGDRLWPVGEAAQTAQIDGLPGDAVSVFDGWADNEDRLDRLAEAIARGRVGADLSLAAESAKYLAPILYPRKVICTGANYYDHLEEMSGRKLGREAVPKPYFFFKPPTTAVVGHGATVRLPVNDTCFDWEIELTAIIGRTCKNVPADEALEVIAGYTIGLDLTARQLHQTPGPGPFGLDWYPGKAQDTHCPMGPFVVPGRFITDVQALDLLLKVNGETKQDASTAGMVYTVFELIEEASRYVTLEPGDALLTGTPAGVAVKTQSWLKSGDSIEATIELLGTLKVRVGG